MVDRSAKANADSAHMMKPHLIKCLTNFFPDALGTLLRIDCEAVPFKDLSLVVTPDDLQLRAADFNTYEISHKEVIGGPKSAR